MGDKTKIEWSDATWNPVTGCTKVSAGCLNCYAELQAARLKDQGVAGYHNGFKLTLQPDRLEQPLKWKKPRKIFVNSMSDLFHKDVPDEYIQKVFDVMNRADQHVFQVLTKRADRLLLMDIAGKLNWTKNIWMGVSVEDQQVHDRIGLLVDTRAYVKFLSVEPLIGPLCIGFPIDKLDWVIVGGESGPGARPMEKAWVEAIQAECVVEGVPFFFKQWGGEYKHETGRTLNGKIYDEMPKSFEGVK